MTNRLTLVGVILLMAMGVAQPSEALLIEYVATLDCMQAGTCGTPLDAYGSLVLEFNTDIQDISFTVTFFNVNSAATAHVHGPALPGDTGPSIWAFAPGWSPYSWGFPMPSAAAAADLAAGLWYFDVHHTFGDARGQILPIPEPNTALLMGLGLFGLAARRRR